MIFQKGVGNTGIIIGGLIVVTLLLVVVGLAPRDSDTNTGLELLSEPSQERLPTDIIEQGGGSSGISAPSPSTPTPAPTTLSGAPLPTMNLMSHKLLQQKGSVGTICWDPLGVCREYNAFPNLSNVDSLKVNTISSVRLITEAHEEPSSLSLVVRKSVSSLEEFPIDLNEIIVQDSVLANELDTSFLLKKFDPGNYVVIVRGQWPEGSVTYGFNIEIE